MDAMVEISWWAVEIVRSCGKKEPVLFAIEGEDPSNLLQQAKKLFGDDVVKLEYEGVAD